MATGTGLSAERMLEIEAASITDGLIDANGHLILSRHDGTTTDAGMAKGDPGVKGKTGADGKDVIDTSYASNLTIGMGVSGNAFGLVDYTLRRLGSLVVGVITIKAAPSITTFTPLTTDSQGNLPDMNGVITLPTGWRNGSGAQYHVPIVQSGYMTWWGRWNSSGGTLDITHGSFPGQKMSPGDQLVVPVQHWVN